MSEREKATGIKKECKSLYELLEKHLSTKESAEIFAQVEKVRQRGYFKKEEFFKVAMWKTVRQKGNYLKNTEEDIIEISKKALSIKDEIERIKLLKTLQGVGIPVASALLTTFNPHIYGIIDVRVWKLLYLYEEVDVKPHGSHFALYNWQDYLNSIRSLSKEFKVKARDIDRTLFEYYPIIKAKRPCY